LLNPQAEDDADDLVEASKIKEEIDRITNCSFLVNKNADKINYIGMLSRVNIPRSVLQTNVQNINIVSPNSEKNYASFESRKSIAGKRKVPKNYQILNSRPPTPISMVRFD
jgi:hypothetical protein